MRAPQCAQTANCLYACYQRERSRFGAISRVTNSKIAAHAEDAETIWIFIRLDPLVENFSTKALTMTKSLATADVIECEEFQLSDFTVALAGATNAAVVLKGVLL